MRTPSCTASVFASSSDGRPGSVSTRKAFAPNDCSVTLLCTIPCRAKKPSTVASSHDASSTSTTPPGSVISAPDSVRKTGSAPSLCSHTFTDPVAVVPGVRPLLLLGGRRVCRPRRGRGGLGRGPRRLRVRWPEPVKSLESESASSSLVVTTTVREPAGGEAVGVEVGSAVVGAGLGEGLGVGAAACCAGGGEGLATGAAVSLGAVAVGSGVAVGGAGSLQASGPRNCLRAERWPRRLPTGRTSRLIPDPLHPAARTFRGYRRTRRPGTLPRPATRRRDANRGAGDLDAVEHEVERVIAVAGEVHADEFTSTRAVPLVPPVTGGRGMSPWMRSMISLPSAS